MDSHRFDTLTRSLSSRLSRRTALQASGVGLAAGLAAVAPLRAAAQDAGATPVVLDGVTLTPGAFLFVQSAASGTFAANPGAGTPTAGSPMVTGGGADYLLTLEGHTGNTVFFSDRPERVFGEAPTQTFLDGLGFAPSNPPNAALVTNDADGNEDILVVELLTPTYDADAGSVTYGVNILSDYEGGLDFVAGRQGDEDLGATFGAASLFIDDCPDLQGCFTGGSPIKWATYIGEIPDGLSTGTCWHWKDLTCLPCNGDDISVYNDACNAAYPDCGGKCYAP